MSTTPRNLPRFLPTLTEVIPPSGLDKALSAQGPDPEALVQTVMQRLELVIEHRLREEAEAIVRAQVAEQLQAVSARLRQELETAVRQAVADAMKS